MLRMPAMRASPLPAASSENEDSNAKAVLLERLEAMRASPLSTFSASSTSSTSSSEDEDSAEENSPGAASPAPEGGASPRDANDDDDDEDDNKLALVEPKAPALVPSADEKPIRRSQRVRSKGSKSAVASPASTKKPRTKPVAGGSRAVACLGCTTSAFSGRSDGVCVDIVGAARRCHRCASASHKCEPVPAMARRAAVSLLAAHRSKAGKKDLDEARTRWRVLYAESLLPLEPSDPSCAAAVGSGKELEEEEEEVELAPQQSSAQREIAETNSERSGAPGGMPRRFSSHELGMLLVHHSRPGLARDAG